MRAVPQQTRSLERKRQIVEAAFAVIKREGRDQFTTEQIAVEAGVSIGTIYRYFNDRVDVLDELFPYRVPGLGPGAKVDEIVTRRVIKG